MTTARVIASDDPGAAARTAKNETTAPGPPNQPGSDLKGRTPMVGKTTPPSISTADVRQSRLGALRELRAARDSMSRWTDAIRRAAADRVGSDDLDAVLDDPAYWDAIGLYRQVNDAIWQFAQHAADIEAGGVR